MISKITASQLSKISIPGFKALGFELVQGTNQTSDKIFQKPIVCDKGAGFAVIQSHIKLYQFDAWNEYVQIGASINGFAGNTAQLHPLEAKEENKLFIQELKKAGMVFDYGNNLKASDLPAGGYEKLFLVIKNLEEKGIFKELLTHQYKLTAQAGQVTEDGKKVIDYLVPLFKTRFPDFTKIDDNYDATQTIAFTSNKPNKFGDFPILIFKISANGLTINSTDIPFPEESYTIPSFKQLHMKRDRREHFPYVVWDTSVMKEFNMDRSFSPSDMNRAKVVIVEALDRLERYLRERLTP